MNYVTLQIFIKNQIKERLKNLQIKQLENPEINTENEERKKKKVNISEKYSKLDYAIIY